MGEINYQILKSQHKFEVWLNKFRISWLQIGWNGVWNSQDSIQSYNGIQESR